jgi:1-acyl-sn-glycerol-3-phosphate acyltransferase
MSWCFAATCVNGNIVPPFLLLFVKPFFPSLHERFLSTQARYGWGSLADFAQLQGRLRPRFTGSADARSLALLRAGNAMLVSNHVDATDGLALFVLARTPNPCRVTSPIRNSAPL